MNELLAIVAADLLSTSVMTFFSALVARVAHMDYVEPHLLNRFLASRLRDSLIHHAWRGWVIHFIVGVIFIIGYHLLWSNNVMTHTIADATVLGFASGLLGAAGWRLVRQISPEIRELWHGEYYFQLVLAHIIFAVVASKTYFAIA